MTEVHVSPSASRWYPATGSCARRRGLSRTECLHWLQNRTVGRLAMTAGALPYIAVIRYYLIGETVFIDMGSPEVAESITGHVVALESGTSDADQQHEIWSVCAVGVTGPRTGGTRRRDDPGDASRALERVGGHADRSGRRLDSRRG